jgi:hypothetical protein
LAAELARAKRENAHLGRRLERAEAIIEIQKKRSWTAVPPVEGETGALILGVGGERPSTFWWCMPRKKTWSMGFCGLESGDAYGDPD